MAVQKAPPNSSDVSVVYTILWVPANCSVPHSLS